MPPPPILSAEINRIDSRVKAMTALLEDVDSIVQGVFASQLAIASAGLVERSVIEVLSEYGRRHGNAALSRYVQKTVARNNSLNCNKIEDILTHFNTEWWSGLAEQMTPPEKSAIDSLKTLRDQVAHGGACGAGYGTVNGYYKSVKTFVDKLCVVVLGA